ncbi:glycoside hydrolase family 15 protein [Dyella jejuensis]|uniref:Glycoside hydrolase family 15 protein n=1 Tax=Dyella jejuensis TaxID=1432009 RepID=A0ABW8JIH3_9GAMM
MNKAMESNGKDRAYRNIDDYAAIGNCHGLALVARDGRIDWCALQSLDAAPMYFRLLDDARGGYLDTRPIGVFQQRRRYLPGTNVLETTFEGESGRAILVDFMPLGRQPLASAEASVDIQALHWLVRVIRVLEGELTFELDMLPCMAWGRRPSQLRQAKRGVEWDEGALLCDHPITTAGDAHARGKIRLRAGEQARLILVAGQCPPADMALSRVDALLAVACAYWHDWSNRCRDTGPYADAVARSALALKLLTYVPTGAIVAAATTSLPEALGDTRNWDYRLSWVRDSTLTLFALSALGYHEEPEEFCAFLFGCGSGEIFPTQIVYGIHGEQDLTEQQLPHLHGYSGSRPVRVGNAAYRQRQFDVYGEMMDWMQLRATLGGTLERHQRDMLRRTADYVAAHWCEPGQGFWEERGPPDHFLYGKMMCWVALDRAQSLLGGRDYEHVMGDIVAEVHRRGIAPGGYLRKRFDHDEIDAVALKTPSVGFPLPPGCLEATIDEIVAQLGAPMGLYRYKGDDGVPREGTFVACGFWLVDALLFAGRVEEAKRRFAQLLRQANDVGLYAEEIDAASGHFLGNFPQALSHLALIHSATLLRFVEHFGYEALRGTHADRLQQLAQVMEKKALAQHGDPRAAVLDLPRLGLARD